MGHVDAADKKGFGLNVNPSTMNETIIPRMRKGGPIEPTNAEMAFVHGGGFANGDRLGGLFGKEGRLANSLYKGLYLSDAPNKLFGRNGDFRGMGNRKGGKAEDVMKFSVAASAISDMLKAFGKGLPDNQDLKFWTSDTGAPGLKYSRRF
ncbi:MAG: hypothetical protein KAR06_08680 [Deltaproteobacteria bacterium]|nr:hypothetical protein [Deltaproteobacteria bacterium]